MKKLLIFILLAFSLFANATNYYVKSTGSDAAAGTSDALAWATITKVNATTFSPGDSILFKRGDVFTGSISPTASGSAGNKIVYGAYGTGNAPVISGFATISAWTNDGGGIYSNSLISPQSAIKLLTINGVIMPKGRYPNSTTLTYESFSATTLTDNQLSNTPNWTGAEVAVRATQYNWFVYPITDHTNTVLTHASGSTDLKNGYGYFIQNDINTLDVFGEWCYRNGKLSVYFGANNPASYSVKVATLDYGFSNTRSYVDVVGLEFDGFALDCVLIYGSASYSSVKNCIVKYGGVAGIASSSNGGIVDGNTITKCLAQGIIYSTNPAVITNNTISQIGIWYGQSLLSGGSNGIEISSGDNALIQYNSLDSIGKHGIMLRGYNGQVLNNIVNHSAMCLDDVGGIYTSGGTYTGRIIKGNIVLNTIGSLVGTPNSASVSEGIYLDSGSDGASGIYVEGNTVAYSGRSGLRFHNGHDITARFNTFFGNVDGVLIVKSYTGVGYSENQVIKNNIMVANNTNQLCFMVWNYFDGNPLTFGSTDSNYYCRPLAETTPIYTYRSTGTYYSLASWKTALGQDANSNVSPLTLTNANDIRFEYNASKTPKAVSFPGMRYYDAKGASYTNAVILQPYTSLVLLLDNNYIPVTYKTVKCSGKAIKYNGKFIIY